jgi:hypothetical protein
VVAGEAVFDVVVLHSSHFLLSSFTCSSSSSFIVILPCPSTSGHWLRGRSPAVMAKACYLNLCLEGRHIALIPHLYDVLTTDTSCR